MLTITFILLKVIPEFMMMFNEFGVQPPAVLVWICTIGDWFAKFWFLGLFFLFPIGFWWGRRCLRRWNPVTWRQPVISKAARSRRSLAIISRQSDGPATGLAKILQCLPFAQMFFPKFVKAQSRVERGEAPWDSLVTEGVITQRESKALASTNSGETQAWLLRWNANAVGEKLKFRSSMLITSLIWLGNVVLALIVLLICVAVLMSLISFTEGVK